MTTDPIPVVVVDDDFMVAGLHARFVSSADGFAVIGVAHSGAEAIEMVTRLHPALVLLDIHLPDMTGIDVLQRLREQAPAVDVLVITAATESETVRAALRGGVVNYLMKPFSDDDLIARLQHYRRAHRGLAERDTARQSDVDAVFGSQLGGRALLAKGLTSETAELVARCLQGADGSLSTAECSEALGISRGSARRYLEYFASSGRASVTLRYGTAGRPERRYTWADAART